MLVSKNSKKSKKEALLISVLSSHQFLIQGIVSLIFIQLLLSVAAELYPFLEVEYTTLINVISVISAVAMIILYAMGWTYPMSNEIPIIVIAIWFLLSTQISLYCICCHSHHQHPHGLIASAPGVVTASAAVTAEEDSHRLVLPEKMKDGLLEEEEDEERGGRGLVESWHSINKHCRKEDFSYYYSMIGILLFGACFLMDLRNYYLSLWNRFLALIIIIILLVFLVISPVSCSQFQVNQSLVVILRVSIYCILWFLGQFKSITETLLFSHYKYVLKKAKYSEFSNLPQLKKQSTDDSVEVPFLLFRQIDRVARIMKGQGIVIVPTTTIAANNKKISTEEAERALVSNNYAQPKGDEEEKRIQEERKRTDFNNYIDRIHHMNHLFYDNAWFISIFSWKNRHTNRQTQRVFDIIQNLWVLVVPPIPLIILSLISYLWFVRHIHANTSEILYSLKYKRLLEELSSDQV